MYKLVDVWGEGEIFDGTFRTGFRDAWNINKAGQLISNGPDAGREIPQLLKVYDYDNPQFPIADDDVMVLTLMGAPISEGTAIEMARVINWPRGRVILYDPDSDGVANFEKHNSMTLEVVDPSELSWPYNEISVSPAYVYTFDGSAKDEL